MIQEIKGDMVVFGVEGLFNLWLDDFVFYVGGYFSIFMFFFLFCFFGYWGCIEMDMLNEEVVSFYNFERIFQLDMVVDRFCVCFKLIGDLWFIDGFYLDGIGFVCISFDGQISIIKCFEQEL